jgi:hypothetical protein
MTFGREIKTDRVNGIKTGLRGRDRRILVRMRQEKK